MDYPTDSQRWLAGYFLIVNAQALDPTNGTKIGGRGSLSQIGQRNVSYTLNVLVSSFSVRRCSDATNFPAYSSPIAAVVTIALHLANRYRERRIEGQLEILVYQDAN